MKLIGHLCRCITTATVGICGVALLLGAVAVWHVARGPVSVSFFAPYLQDMMNRSDVGVAVDISQSRLFWEAGGRTLDLTAEQVRLVGEGGQTKATLPRLSVSLSIRALLGGEVAPVRVALHRPALKVVRGVDGGLSLDAANADGAGDLGARLINAVIRSDRQDGPLRYLNTVRMEQGTLSIDDRMLGTVWEFPRADVELRRDIDRISWNGSAALRFGGRDTELTVNGRYRPSSGVADVAASFADLVPARFAGLLPGGDRLKTVQLPLSGTVRWEGDGGGLAGALSFDLSSGAGTVALPRAPEQTLPVSYAQLRGRLMDFNDLLIDQFYADLGGPRLNATALFANLQGGGNLRVDAAFENIDFDTLHTRWPTYLAYDVRRWVTGHLSEGAVDKGEVTIAATAPPGDPLALKLTNIGGWMTASNVTVDYLPPMPKVLGAKGRATFGPTHFDIRVSEGHAGPNRITSGTILLSELDKKYERADIELTIASPVDAALALVDHDPLNLTRQIEIPYKELRGDAETRLSLQFPFKKDLKLSELEVSASATLSDVRIPGGLFGIDVEQGDLALNVDKEGMVLAGRVRWHGLPAWMQWDRPFGKETPVLSRYNFDVRIDHHHLARLGVDPRPYVAGELPLKLDVVAYRDKRVDVTGNVDLTRATVNVSAFDWIKKPGVAGNIDFDLGFANGKPTAVRSFTLNAGDMATHGRVSFIPGERRVETIQIDNFSLGATEFAGVLYVRDDGGFDADVSGPSLDAMRLFRKPAARSLALPRITLSGNFEKVWIQPTQAITNVSGAAFYDGNLWRSIVVQGGVGERGRMEMRLGTDGDRRDMVITSNDAGAALRTFGLYRDMVGGVMSIKGVFNDAHPDHPLVGVANVRDYRIRNAPAIAKLLSIASLTGIVESLGGEGLAFSQLRAPFALVDQKLELKSARAYGPSLGITLKGYFDFKQDQLDMEGTIVPAYAINSLLGSLPLVGGLVTGGDTGSGLFAATYSMRGPRSAPDISINPLAALAPGFLRKLFDIFDPDPAQSTTNETGR